MRLAYRNWDVSGIGLSFRYHAGKIGCGGIGLRAVLSARTRRVVDGDADKEDAGEIRYHDQHERQNGHDERKLDCALASLRKPVQLRFGLFRLDSHSIHRVWWL